MGPLPAVRLNPTRPFTYTGVDFAGPFMLKATELRGWPRFYKRYVSLFICLVVKAIHIEIVIDLTTTCFLAAFRRFTARRDNGQSLPQFSTHLSDQQL